MTYPASTSDLAAAKRALRVAARAARAAAGAAVPDAAERIAARVAGLPEAAGPAGVASGYLPIQSELDPGPAMAALASRGWRLALPVVVGAGQSLLFRAWSAGSATEPAPFGLAVPAEGPEVRPDLLLVPMLAFDRRGHRLGYGGGFYDRTLATLRARGGTVRAIGVAFAAQEVADLPAGDTDMRLDAIVTETEVVHPA